MVSVVRDRLSVLIGYEDSTLCVCVCVETAVYCGENNNNNNNNNNNTPNMSNRNTK